MEPASRTYLPGLKSLACVAGVIGAALVMNEVAQLGADTDPGFVASNGFRVWIGVAAFTSVVFVLTAIRGVKELAELSRTTGAGWGEQLLDLAMFLGLVGLIVLLQAVAGWEGFDVPVDHWAWLRSTVFFLGAVSAAPWVMAVWIAHARLAQSKAAVKALPEHSPPAIELARLLVVLRDHIQHTVVALTTVVLGAVLTSGALRNALVPEVATDEEFPASSVLLYGAFFAAVLALAVVPLMTSWRSCAGDVVDHIPEDATDDELVALGASLASTLEDEGSVFRSPLVLVSVLTPVLTGALAALVPQIGS